MSKTLKGVIDCIGLESDDFRLSIASLTRNRQSTGNSRAPTASHVVEATAVDGASMTGKQITSWSLMDFFGFVCGRKCPPVCPVGFTEDSTRVWEAFSSPCLPGGVVSRWSSMLHTNQIVELFPCFTRTMKNETWNKPLHQAIYWYLNANDSHRGIDAGIILIQAAIELVAYTYTVSDKRLLSPKGFKDLRASDKMRLLLGSLGIPTDIPHACTEMQSQTTLNGRQRWDGIAFAFTDIRNTLVHPEAANKERASTCYYDAWRAGLWILELSILAVCGYRGCYRNRLTNEVEQVPWTLHE